jgi:hypothetical protein
LILPKNIKISPLKVKKFQKIKRKSSKVSPFESTKVSQQQQKKKKIVKSLENCGKPLKVQRLGKNCQKSIVRIQTIKCHKTKLGPGKSIPRVSDQKYL